MSGPEITARSLHGRLVLRFAADRGKTRLVEAARTPPFHLQRLLYLDSMCPQLASATILNTTAGLFAGDRLRLEMATEVGAAVAIGTPAMARAFAMPAGEAMIDTEIRVDHDAYLEYLPEPLLLCRDAAVSQRTDLALAPGARVAVGEVVSFGREAAGERHAYRWLRQRLELCYGRQTVLAEALVLEPDAAPVMLGVVGRFGAYGSVLLICRQDHEELLLADIRDRLPLSPEIICAASLLDGVPGISVRVLSASAFLAQGLVRSVIARFRQISGPP